MNIDAELLLSENQVIAAATEYSAVKKIGPSLKLYNPLFVSVQLTTPFTVGKIDKIMIQTAEDAAFTTPIDLIEVVILSGITQTKPAHLMHVRMPQETKKFVRLKYTSTSPAGGKVFASLVKEVPLR